LRDRAGARRSDGRGNEHLLGHARRPYTTLQTRLTTKSNTFTVHYRAQTLRKSPSSDPGVWDEERDRVTGEFRGATTLERYITPKDTRIPDYAAYYGGSAGGAEPEDLGAFYKWRILNTRRFAP